MKQTIAYYAAYFQICDFTFKNIYDNNLNYIAFILETWIHILRDILLIIACCHWLPLLRGGLCKSTEYS